MPIKYRGGCLGGRSGTAAFCPMLAISRKLGYAFDMLFRIRPVLPSDRTQWEALWNGYQIFYKTKIPAQTTDITWARFFESDEPVYALVAEEGGSLIGLVQDLGFVQYRKDL